MNAQLFNDPMVSGADPIPAAVATPLQPAPLPLAPVGTKAVELDFAGGRWSSEAGVVLLKAIDAPLGLPRALAAVLSDPREGRRLHFTPEAWLKQRGFPSAAGSEDAHDANTLRDDPLCKRLLDPLPATGAPVASPPTLSRFANRLSRPALSRMALVWLEPCIASSASPPSVIGLAGDDTEAPVHGAQAQARYDREDGGAWFMLLPRYAGLSGRLLTPILKAKRFTGTPRLAVLKRLGKPLRHAWPDPLVLCRGDSPCASPEVRPWSDAPPARHCGTG
jgi:hypothetical protein